MKNSKRILHGFAGYTAHIFRERKVFFVCGAVFMAASVLENYMMVYLPKLVAQGVEEQWTLQHLMLCTVGFILCMLAVQWISDECMHGRIGRYNQLVVQKMRVNFTEKLLNIDYRYLEDSTFQEKRNLVRESLWVGEADGSEESAKLWDFGSTLFDWLGAIALLLVYLWQLGKLSPILPLFALFFPAAMLFDGQLLSKAETEWAEGGAQAWQKMDYISRRTEDFSMAKDIRLYNMADWVLGLFSRYRNQRLLCKKKELQMRAFGSSITFAIPVGLFYFGVFLMVICRFRDGLLSAADIVFYSTLIGSLTTRIYYQIVPDTPQLIKMSLGYLRYEEFLAYGEDTGTADVPLVRTAPKIELEHVSFSYPGSDRKILDDLSVTIEPGQRIAVVGVNGAGKTTLMKLICGLLCPTKGRILLNGMDMARMMPEERYAWFSCAFQDVQFLPASVRENVSMQAADNPRVWECLEMAGIREAIEALPLRDETLMEKSLNEDATDFSGGQRQKLVLARALYRDAGGLILDEPTAALDALAEDEIYKRYAAFSQKKTSFFVSHRLSSTRFCDRILLLDGGVVAEDGTHEELLSQNGLYAKMFSLQSKYYDTRGKSR